MFPSPSLTVPSISTWEFNYNNALTFGATTPWGILNIEGLDLANIASNDVQRPRDYGMVVGLDTLADRTVTIDMWVKSDGVSLQDSQLQLAAAFPIMPESDRFPLWFQIPNLPILCVMCRVRKRTVPIDTDYASGNIAKPTLVLHATDPRIYGVGLSQTMGLGSGPATGLGPFPVGPFPVTFGAGSNVTTTTITNSGNCEMRPYALFTGPLTNPFLGNNNQNAIVTLSNPQQGSGYTVAVGDQMSVDFDTHVVTYYPGGTSSSNASYPVANFVTQNSTWWDLPDGSSTIAFGSADSTNTGGTVALEYASAYQL